MLWHEEIVSVALYYANSISFFVTKLTLGCDLCYTHDNIKFNDWRQVSL